MHRPMLSERKKHKIWKNKHPVARQLEWTNTKRIQAPSKSSMDRIYMQEIFP